MSSLRLKIALWFTLSMVSVLGVFTLITYVQLRHELRVERWERLRPDHADWTLHGSYSESEVADIVGEFARLALMYAVPVAALAFLIGHALAKRSFQPVADLEQQLSGIGARNLARRVALPGVDREFRPIVAQINLLLDRLENSFGQLTEYSAQVAHELRTPLTLLRLKLEDAADRIEPELSESIQHELARLSDYVEQCLLLATAEQGRLAVEKQPIALQPFLEELIETYQLWAGQQDRTVTYTAAGDFTVSSDPRYLRQILHNLLANAVRHGHGTIQVTLAGTPSAPFCRIENGIASHEVIPHRAGLGLRISRALAPVIGCRLETRTAENRFIAELTWPPSPVPSRPIIDQPASPHA
ncbi:MAG TPA: histidine kinase dimerization/phospho-acceptor domain-containing protein [Opitutaceae bacterium]